MKQSRVNEQLELETTKREIQAQYSSLQFFTENGQIYIRGSFPISYESRVLDRFVIEIEISQNNQSDIPLVREIGGRIPRTTDNHINPSGEICLFVPDERWKVFPKGSSILDFLNGPVRNYLLGFSLKARGEKWPFGERAHGKQGIIEFYTELLGTAEERVIKKYLEYLSAKNPKGHWACPCLSGRRLRDCHRAQLEHLRSKIDRPIAAKSLTYFQ